MAQNITLLGAQYSAVPAVQLPKTGGGTARFDDASITTAVASDVTQGKLFLAADGTITTGTNSGGGGALTVTATFSNGEWSTLDKTFAQIQSAYNNGDTIITSAYNTSADEPCETYCEYLDEDNLFWYRIAWFDYNNTGYQCIDDYSLTADGCILDNRATYSTPATLVGKTITANGTYDPIQTDYADGYSLVTVNVSGGSSWTKVAENTYTVNTTNTGTVGVGTLYSDSAIYTADKIVYVRIRDTAGKRAGYFYGTDNFFINYNAVNSSTSTLTNAARFCYSYTSSGNYSAYIAASGYGVYCNGIGQTNDVNIYTRYHSSRSLTINGTYKVEVYLLDPPTGAPIFT